MASDPEPRRTFSREFDQEFPVEPQGNKAYFGTNVLRGLIDGIDDFAQWGQPRWRRYRSMGPAMLGVAMWIDDEELLTKLGDLSAACIVVTKQERRSDKRKFERLVAANISTPGMPLRVFSGLSGLAPKVGGKPAVVGPTSPMDDYVMPTIRTLGFRRVAGRSEKLVPIVHAKLALLGHLWQHDEDGLGPADVMGFAARRLWVSSANFTSSSRQSLEFGFWTEDPALLRGAERFLVTLMRYSEGLDPDADSVEPDLAEPEFDDDAMAEAWSDQIRWAEMDWDEDE